MVRQPCPFKLVRRLSETDGKEERMQGLYRGCAMVEVVDSGASKCVIGNAFISAPQ